MWTVAGSETFFFLIIAETTLFVEIPFEHQHKSKSRCIRSVPLPNIEMFSAPLAVPSLKASVWAALMASPCKCVHELYPQFTTSFCYNSHEQTFVRVVTKTCF